MKRFTMYTATVIDNDDKDKAGKIQIQIFPELKDVQASLLPWAIPFFSLQGGKGNKQLSNDLPEIGSKIRVLVSHRWKRFYYLPDNRFFEGLFKYDSITTALNKVKESPDATYKYLKFRMYADGGLEWHNNKTGEHGFVHKSGGYTFFDKDGNQFTNLGDKKFKYYNSVTTMKKILKDIHQILVNINTTGNMTVTVPSAPAPIPVISPNFATDLVTLQQDITNLDALMED